AVDPVDRWLGRDPAQMVAEEFCRLVIADDRIVAAERQQHDARAVPAEFRVTFEGARENFGAEERARAVTDQYDLLCLGVARDLAEMLREAVEPRIPFWQLAV